MIPKRYDKFGTVKILTVSRKQWYKNFENPSKFICIVHPLVNFHYSQLEATFGTKFIEIGEKKFCARACPLLH